MFFLQLKVKITNKDPNLYSKTMKPHTWFDYAVESMINDDIIIQQSLKLNNEAFQI